MMMRICALLLILNLPRNGWIPAGGVGGRVRGLAPSFHSALPLPSSSPALPGKHLLVLSVS